MKIRQILIGIASQIFESSKPGISAAKSLPANPNKPQPRGNVNGPSWHHLHMQPGLPKTHVAAPFNLHPLIGSPSILPLFQVPTVMLPPIFVVIRVNGSPRFIPSLAQWPHGFSTPIAAPMMRMDHSPIMLKTNDASSPQTPTLTEGLYESNDSDDSIKSLAPFAYNSNPGQKTQSSTSTGSDDDRNIKFIQF